MSDQPAEPQESADTPDAEEHAPSAAPSQYDDPVLLEEDETIPPRPEEEIADQLRQEPRP